MEPASLRNETGGGETLRLKAAAAQLHRDAGPVRAQFTTAQPTHPDGRVVDDNVVFAYTAQHHKVIHVPVQDAWRLQSGELVDFQSQWPAGKTERLRHLDKVREPNAPQRQRKMPSQCRQVNVMPVIPGNHHQTRGATFGGFALASHWQAFAQAEVQAWSLWLPL